MAKKMHFRMLIRQLYLLIQIESVKLWTSQSNRKSSKFYCDFKFRSGTFNEGYVGGDIIVGMTKTPG